MLQSSLIKYLKSPVIILAGNISQMVSILHMMDKEPGPLRADVGTLFFNVTAPSIIQLNRVGGAELNGEWVWGNQGLCRVYIRVCLWGRSFFFF